MIIAGTVLLGFTPAIFFLLISKKINFLIMLRSERFLEVVEQVQWSMIHKTMLLF